MGSNLSPLALAPSSDSRSLLLSCPAGGGTGVPDLCPHLEKFTPVPSYVALSLTPVDGRVTLLREDGEKTEHPILVGQPEVFIGPPGTITEMHMDNWLVPFWMSVYIGRKTFRTISFEDSSKHMPYYFGEHRASRFTKDGVQLEIFDPDLEVFTELEKVTVWEGTLNPGDWIYLPSGTLHGGKREH